MSEVTFEPFQKVLVRDDDVHTWQAALFGYRENSTHPYRTLNGVRWIYCLPYEGNERLLGTTDSPTPPEPEFKFGDKVVVKNAEDGNWCEAIFINYHEKDVAAILRVDPSVISLWYYCRHANWDW